MTNLLNERAGRLTELLSGKLFLAICILVTVQSALSALSYVMSIVGILFAAIPVLLIIGVWTLRQSAINGFYKGYSFSLIKVQPIALAVAYILAMLGVLLLMAVTGMLISALLTAIDGVIDGTLFSATTDNAALNEAISSLFDGVNLKTIQEYADWSMVRDNVAAYGSTVLYIIEAVILAVLALLTVGAFKVSGIVSRLHNTLMFGHDEPIKTTYVSALLYISAGFQLIGLLTQIISLSSLPGAAGIFAGMSAILSSITTLIGIAVMVLAAIFFGKVKEIME